ncbi:unnamed protein product [Agarophyton chilense]|eukprot:gb/GEZJ01005737.1/.p1 GENE.gb/GEZJ01005737.1/~~gb/GEZJ01005737.1/.p1  ORF type:complete len:474 (+),score=53.06 gb/GEZJ01005737.1/:325-1746(+)
MSTVHKDPRIRAVSTADGRGYARNPHMFIDVLRIPSITDAVDEASRLLRLGIVRAMQSNPNTDADADVSKEGRTNKPSVQTAAAQRDPVSVYSAVTKRVDKGVEETQKKEPQPTDLERPKSALKGWNSTKKAGPSILSKRSMSNSTSVFQPAPKREKKTEAQQNDIAKMDKAESDPSSRDEKGKAEKQIKVAHKSKVSLEHSDGKTSTIQEGNGSHQRGNSKAVKKNGIKVVNQFKTNAIPSTSMSGSSQVVKEKNIGEASTPRSASAVWAKAVNASNAEKALKQKSTLMVGARRSGLPASWGQVSSGRVASKQPSVLSMLRKSSGSGQAKLQMGRSATNSLASVTQSVTRPQTVGMNTSRSSAIPMPSTTGLEVQYVPGSEVIGGVRPNGYTVSRQGVVKPVITFNPKPKVPHKLRQTSVEKLFEGWRDNQHLSEGEALAKALRTEQEMYAAANNRVDYRAAVTVKLKEIRK